VQTEKKNLITDFKYRIVWIGLDGPSPFPEMISTFWTKTIETLISFLGFLKFVPDLGLSMAAMHFRSILPETAIISI